MKLTAAEIRSSWFLRVLSASLVLASLAVFSIAWAQQPQSAPTPGTVATAPVIIDGRVLFALRGVTAYPAERRAEQVRSDIVAAAEDEAITLSDIRLANLEDRTNIYAGERRLLSVFDVDAEVEGLQRELLAQIYMARISEAISDYRDARSSGTLWRNGLVALALTAVLALLIWGLRWAFRGLNRWVERNVKRSVHQLASKSHQVIRAAPIWSLISTLLRLTRLAAYLALIYFYLNTVLGLFPWSRPAARVLLQLVLNPLAKLWQGFISQLPNLVFLLVLWIVVRYLLRVVKTFFRGVGDGRIRLENFEAEWADPTYKIVRILAIAFAIVLAYPYIPGSDSAAFKGVSVFLGVLLSLGSTSFIANMIAGLTMTYRGAFREGDLVKVGDTIGRVEEVRLMVTRLRTARNERVILPNSNILSTDVTNYSQTAGTDGLIVHSTVGIGYDTPWRQVEAMLIEAARRTEALEDDPPPFVLQGELGDFAVQYLINAYWNGEGNLLEVRSELHANVQDVFNEHGVQIMSPAYENDPEAPKVVPPEKWYEAPAKKPDS